MALTQERRTPPREKGDIPFSFFGQATGPFPAIAQDASIRSARFPLSSRAAIEPFVSGGGEIVFGPITASFERLDIPSHLVRPDEDTFVVTYKTRQLRDEETRDGYAASYRVVKFIGAGQTAETYRAEVVAIRTGGDALHIGDQVVIKVPLFFPYLQESQINECSARLDALLGREEAGWRRLADLPCAAGLLDLGSHRFPLDGTSTTRFLVQRFVEGDPLEAYLLRAHVNPETGTFTGLPRDEFRLLAGLLAEALLQMHARHVTHGDVCPENILVRSTGEPVLIDLGQAVFREAAAPIVRVAERNLRYLNPEGERSAGGDVYSLGGVLFYLATGEDPPSQVPAPAPDLRRLSSTILERIHARNPRWSRDARGIADVIAHCLCAGDSRYPTVRTAIERLDLFFSEPNHTSGARVSAAIHEAANEGRHLEFMGPEFFRRLAVARAHRLREDLVNMGRGVCEVAGDPDAIAASLTQFLALLGERDEFVAISTPRFYRPGNPGTNPEFLSMNLLAAGRGATIKRLLMVGPEDWGHEPLQRMMETQVQALLEARDLAPRGSYEVKVLFLSQETQDRLSNRPCFSLLTKHGEIVAALPDYREDGSMAAVTFKAGQHLVGDLRAAFEAFWRHDDAVVLRRWPTPEEIEVRAFEKYAGRGRLDGFHETDYVEARRELIEEETPGGV